MKICHVTSAHTAYDPRIFLKECCSLAEAGYEVYLVAPNAVEEVRNGVNIIGVPILNKGRLYRMTRGVSDVYHKVLNIDADVYHLHDPELLRIANKLRKRKKKIIFDSHENVPSQILSKYWIPKFLRKYIACIYKNFERRTLKKLDAVVSVTPELTERLMRINPKTYQITNYPIIKELFVDERQWGKSICFAGGIREQWCCKVIMKALEELPNIDYYVAGIVRDDYLQEISELKNGIQFKYVGKLPHNEVFPFIQCSTIGMAVHEYSPSVGGNLGTLGNTKLFESMEAGIPVICSDFVLWKEIIDKYKCGIYVSPERPREITDAIKHLLDHPEEAKQMGNNGRRAVLEEYNWNTQKAVLIRMYKDLENL